MLSKDTKQLAWALSIHPDNKKVAVWGPVLVPNTIELAKSQVSVVEIATGKAILAFEQDGEAGEGIAYSPDGQWLAAGRCFYDAQTGKKEFSLPQQNERIHAIAFSPNGKLLATGSGVYKVGERGETKIWDVQARKEVFNLGETGLVESLCFSPDGSRLAEGGSGRGVRIWNTETGKPVKQLVSAAMNVAFSPDGFCLAMTWNYQASVWDVATGKKIYDLQPGQAHVRGLAFRPDGRRLATGQRYATVMVWDVGAMRTIGPWKQEQSGQIQWLAFHPDDSSLAWSTGRDVKLISRHTGKELWHWTGGGKLMVNAIAFCPNEDRLAVAVSPESGAETGAAIVLLQSSTGRVIQKFPYPHREIAVVAYSPDGRFLLASGWEESVYLLDARTGRQVSWIHHNPKGDLASCAFSPDGNIVAVQTRQGTFLWDRTKEKMVLTIPAGGFWPTRLVFSPNGKRLLAGGTVFEVPTGRACFDINPGFVPGYRDAAFGPDSKRLLTDDGMQWFDVDTGTETARFKFGEDPAASAVACSADGKCIAAVNEGGTLQFWESK